MSVQTVTVGAPGPFVTTNQRHHWTVRNRITQAWRTAAAWQARADRLRPVDGPVHIEALICRGDSRRYDLDGHVPTLKACVDGLRDAGVLPEDSTEHVPTLTLRAGPKTDPGCLVITITPKGDTRWRGHKASLAVRDEVGTLRGADAPHHREPHLRRARTRRLSLHRPDRRAVMPTYIIKPSRDEDFYVWWSTVVDAPIGWGPRDYVPLDNEGSPERFARADERGTSANWPDWPVEKMPFGWNVSEWRITNQDDLEETGEGWWLLPRKNLREFCRRRDAGEQIADLVKWEADELTDTDDGSK